VWHGVDCQVRRQAGHGAAHSSGTHRFWFFFSCARGRVAAALASLALTAHSLLNYFFVRFFSFSELPSSFLLCRGLRSNQNPYKSVRDERTDGTYQPVDL